MFEISFCHEPFLSEKRNGAVGKVDATCAVTEIVSWSLEFYFLFKKKSSCIRYNYLCVPNQSECRNGVVA